MDKPTEQLKYSIFEDKENKAQSVILKEGINTTFTIQDIGENRKYLNDKKKELEAETMVNEAGKQNILNTHPQVKDFDEKLLIAAAAYYQFKNKVKANLDTLQKINDQLKADEQELVDIAKQTGLQTQINQGGNIEMFTAGLNLSHNDK